MALKSVSSSQLRKSLGFASKAKDDLRKRGEKLRHGTLSLVRRTDAAYGDQSAEGKCRLGHVIGLMSSPLTGT